MTSPTRNDPNLYSDRGPFSLAAAGIAAAIGWCVGAEMVLYHYTQTFQPPIALFHLILHWGLAPAPWGWRRFVPAAVAALFGASAGGAVWRLLTIPSERHIRGFILHRDPRQIAAALKPGKTEAPGVSIHPAVQISQAIETRHTLLVGGSGGGKTTILWPLIQQAQARGDRILLFDSKGDFTEKLGGNFTLLSPTDSRSARWEVGRDILTAIDAHALTETLIPSAPGGDKEPMWTNGARALLLGVITDIQRRHGKKWGFVVLAAAIAEALADFETLKTIISREDPAMLSLLGGEDAAAPSRTTMGFLVQVATSVRHVINLGVAAADLAQSKNAGWAVRAWLAGQTPPVAVVGFRDSARSLSQAWAASLIEQTVRQVGDMPDASPADRRIWLIIDEAPRSGKVPSVTDALTTARSKGLRVILGIQSLAQIREVYTRETATTWAGQTASKIICQTTAPEDQKWCSDLLGEREVERYTHQTSQNYHNDSGAQHSSSWQRVREPVLLPAAFGQELRVLPTGPRALLMSGGEAALLDWPFPPLQKHRPAYVQARWTQPGYARPVWGKAPPDVAAPPTTTDRPDEKKAKRREEAAPTPPTPAPVTLSGDLPDFPTTPTAQESPGDDLAKEVAGHTLDVAVPGASLAARILEMAAGASGQVPPAAAQQSAPLIPEQGQEKEDEREDEA